MRIKLPHIESRTKLVLSLCEGVRKHVGHIIKQQSPPPMEAQNTSSQFPCVPMHVLQVIIIIIIITVIAYICPCVRRRPLPKMRDHSLHAGSVRIGNMTHSINCFSDLSRFPYDIYIVKLGMFCVYFLYEILRHLLV